MSALLCLTYDDALPVHRELVAPALAARGLRGTFYAPAAAGDLHQAVDAWRAVAAAGHELGNHTCWHPCRLRPGSAYVPAYQLQDYTHRRIRDELRLANQVLTLVDGQTQRSYAATCHDTTIGPDPGASFFAEMAELFPIVRAGHAQAPSAGPMPFITPAFSADRRSAAEVIAAAEQMRGVADAWLVVLMHGVGEGTHNHHMAAEEHARLIDWLAEQSGWLAGVTLCEAARRRGVQA
ncbi:MAG: polysaccharide deacetylase family protein [Armatimonadetes bacterium]|nr:polysaccharide deacetylase family protein [Armatimonadota bacterium]